MSQQTTPPQQDGKHKFKVPTKGYFEITYPDGSTRTVLAPLGSTLQELLAIPPSSDTPQSDDELRQIIYNFIDPSVAGLTEAKKAVDDAITAIRQWAAKQTPTAPVEPLEDGELREQVVIMLDMDKPKPTVDEAIAFFKAQQTALLDEVEAEVINKTYEIYLTKDDNGNVDMADDVVLHWGMLRRNQRQALANIKLERGLS
jgi:hypothetical protein